MLRPIPRFPSFALIFAALVFGLGCSDESEETPANEDGIDEAELAGLSPEEAEARRLDANFPKHGAVLGIQLRLHLEPNEDAPVVGWVRMGTRLRLKEETRQGPGCAGPWYAVNPMGWLCGGDDNIFVGDAPIEIEEPTEYGWHDTPTQAEAAAARGAVVLPPTATDAPLPYAYYFVKEPTVPEYHRLPSRNEQRAAGAKAERFQSLLANNEARAWRYLRGEAEDGPPGTAVTHRYLQHGFFVAVTGEELRARRRFVRTTQGRFIKKGRLEERNGSDFHGVEITEERPLPVAWTTRASRLQLKVDAEDGSVSWVNDEEREALPRQTLLEGWQERRNVSGRVVHIIESPEGLRYLRHFRASVARQVDRPEGVTEDEPWVHIDLSEQTLVMYRGDAPIYATLISSGLDEHATPTGLFEIRRKHVTDTMSNLGGGNEDSYRIEDVPHTQYFEGSFALHTAFWHTRFGIQKSHGCINMAPVDAHWVFQRTWPELPEGWHGASTDQTPLQGSHVYITE